MMDLKRQLDIPSLNQYFHINDLIVMPTKPMHSKYANHCHGQIIDNCICEMTLGL